MQGLTITQLKAWQPPPTKWLVENIIRNQGKVVLFGKYGSWKSMLAMDMAYHIAQGQDWMGYKTSKCGVYIAQTEITQDGYRDRLIDYERHNSVSDNVWIATEPYFKIDKSWGQAWLEPELAKYKPKLVIFDCLYSMFSGHLSDEYDMRQLTDKFNQLQAKYDFASVIIHHPRKAQFDDGQEVDAGGEDAFGSMLVNWCDVALRIVWTESVSTMQVRFDKPSRYSRVLLHPFAVSVDRKALTFRRQV